VYVLVVDSPPILLNDLSQPPGYLGRQLLLIITVAHPQGPQLGHFSLPLHTMFVALEFISFIFRVALDILNCFMMFLWGTLVLQSYNLSVSSLEAL